MKLWMEKQLSWPERLILLIIGGSMMALLLMFKTGVVIIKKSSINPLTLKTDKTPLDWQKIWERIKH